MRNAIATIANATLPTAAVALPLPAALPALPTVTAPTAPVAGRTSARAVAQAGNAHKYGAQAHNMPNGSTVYKLTNLGATVAANGGLGKQGKPTVMGCVAVAAAHLAAKGKPLTGTNIAAAMQALPNMRAAIAGSKAAGMYAANGAYCYRWLAGYIAGAARSAAGLLTA